MGKKTDGLIVVLSVLVLAILMYALGFGIFSLLVKLICCCFGIAMLPLRFVIGIWLILCLIKALFGKSDSK